MATLTLQHPKDDFLNTFLKPEQNMLVIKSINTTPILTRYYPQKTTVKSVMETLLNKIKYTYQVGGDSEYSENPNIILKYKENYLSESEKKLSEYGISNRYEEVKIFIKPRNVEQFEYAPSNIIVDILNSRSKDQGKNQYFIKTLTGKTITLFLPKDALVYEMKACVHLKEGTPPDQQRIIFQGREMELDKKITDIGASNEATFHLVLRLCGGMYHEVSGRDGKYAELKEIDGIVFDIDPEEEQK